MVLYVDKQGDTFYQSMLLNFSMTRTKKSDTIAEHFYSNGHSVQDFSVIGIEKKCEMKRTGRSRNPSG